MAWAGSQEGLVFVCFVDRGFGVVFFVWEQRAVRFFGRWRRGTFSESGVVYSSIGQHRRTEQVRGGAQGIETGRSTCARAPQEAEHGSPVGAGRRAARGTTPAAAPHRDTRQIWNKNAYEKSAKI